MPARRVSPRGSWRRSSRGRVVVRTTRGCHSGHAGRDPHEYFGAGHVRAPVHPVARPLVDVLPNGLGVLWPLRGRARSLLATNRQVERGVPVDVDPRTLSRRDHRAPQVRPAIHSYSDTGKSRVGHYPNEPAAMERRAHRPRLRLRRAPAGRVQPPGFAAGRRTEPGKPVPMDGGAPA